MAAPLVEEIVGKYVELRDRKAAMAEKHKQELAPIAEAMDNIENYLMHLLNEQGVDSFKTKSGTAFRATATSCQMQDAEEFKSFIFKPVIDSVVNYLTNSGYAIRDTDYGVINNIIRDMPRWDMVDFRAGKKGITEYIENEKQPVPGVAINTVSTVNIRRA